eukprot:CAMPEP_0206227866 /NCGR_PEP_ID=MMETSP0047_2-20121206/8858_1 /ASSEMBLY_ACC=CAM_ASM_000192 /TAXON_ID=195065 /ORGANISM="Chroomonas mesostigmatica_cf, Strain CCMP1168" /LENGTH=284 /DNA_ID=CAMNT_0053651059 /DNA_START=10 /DNA_END=864 /DNA_ORIENTATION=-
MSILGSIGRTGWLAGRSVAAAALPRSAPQALPPWARAGWGVCKRGMTVEVARSKPLRVSLEGNIASGKSTLLDMLREEFSVYCVPEPVSRWQSVNSERENKNGGNLLDSFYRDPKRWAYTFQSYAFLSRLQAQIEPLDPPGGPKEVVVYERSVFSDKHIFGANCKEMALFNDMEWGIYCDWHKWLVSSFDVSLDAVLYLRTRPETCMERLKKRSRTEEAEISLEYLKSLHDRHDTWLCPESGKVDFCGVSPPKLLVLDCDQEFESDTVRYQEVLGQVRTFLKAL